MKWISSGSEGGGGGAPSGAAGGDLSGTYPNPGVQDDSHSHTAATLPATMPPAAHKTSHENGGADEISVAGLSGALADPQTPAAHASTHYSGGSDPLAGAVGVLTQLDVDNVRVDGNTVSTTNANGNLALTPNGTGFVSVKGFTAGLDAAANNELFLVSNAVPVLEMYLATNPMIRSDGQYTISSGVAVGGTAVPGVGEKLDSAGTWLDTDGTTGLGKRLTGRAVEANTAGSGSPNILAATESRKLLTNEGVTAENYHTLPSAAAGIEFVFYCQDTDGIRVVAGAGDTIRRGATVSAAAGFVKSTTVGSALILVAINATEWVAISEIGTWTTDA